MTMRPERETSPSALDWPARAGTADLLLQELATRARVRRRRRATLAAAVAVVVLALGASAMWRLRPPRATAAAAIVSIPTQRTLPDGSVVELKDGAQLTADFSGPLRRVELTRGTAHFQVVKNPDRPFVVSAGGIAVRAVGTAFSGELERGVVEVLVTEGRVAVEPSNSSAAAQREFATVDAGAGVVLELAPVATGAGPVVRAVPVATMEEKLAWRARQLELSGTPLAEVVAMLNRHAGSRPNLQFVIADPEIETVKLSGVVRTDKTDALVHLLEAECGVRAERRSDGQIVLHKAH
jgi:transmembrane sensor